MSSFPESPKSRMMMSAEGPLRKAHWDQVYTTKGENERSWSESLPSASLELLEAAGLNAFT